MNQQEFFKRYTYNVRTDKIGGGGFGTVYKAYDNILHRDVAIKVSEVKTASNGKTFSLKDEFDALKGLPKHQNIANYEELYRFEGPQGVFDYAVMQYYPEGNLSNVIKSGLNAEQKEDIATQLLEGLDFLHAHKVVHRDLKPGNVLIVRHGGHIIPLITDFGLSKSADSGDGSIFSNSFGGGTARYSSPEQLQGKPLRFNTDLWSYGAVIYELFTGRSLFEAGSSAANTAQADLEIYNKIINGDTDGRMHDVPDRWGQVLQRCMVVDPEKRAKSAEELFKILAVTANPAKEGNTSRPTAEDKTEVAEEGNKKETYPQPQQSDNSQPQARWRKTLPWIIAGLSVAVALVSLVMSMRMRQNNTTPEATTTVHNTSSANDFKFDNVTGRSIPKSQMVFSGDSYEADIIVAAFNKSTPEVWYKMGADTLTEEGLGSATKLEGEDGIVKLKIGTSGTGEQKYAGLIKIIDPSGQPKYYGFRDKFTVLTPSASISADKMNVLYAGIANPVSVSGPVSPDKLSISFPGCNVTSTGGGRFNVTVPASLIGKTVTATVAAKVGGSTKTMGSTTFRVKKVPDPRGVLGAGIRGGKRSKAELLANPMIRATMGDDFVYDLKWNVNSYRVVIVNKGLEEPAIVCQGGMLSDKAKDAIQKASSNATIFFNDIKVSSEAGTRTLDEFCVRIR